MAKKKQVKTDWKVILGGMACLTVVELYALRLGYNGTILKAFLMIMGLAIGTQIENPLKK